MTEPAAHKRNFVSFIEPNYARCESVDPSRVRDAFQDFMNKCLAEVPDDAPPADGYMYNAHMGNFARELDHAKDSFTKALLAYHRKRDSCKQQ